MRTIAIWAASSLLAAVGGSTAAFATASAQADAQDGTGIAHSGEQPAFFVRSAGHVVPVTAGDLRGRHAEARDDRGRHAEPGDDHGRQAEPRDDHGRHAEPGDDHGRQAEAGDDHGSHGGHGDRGRHGGHGSDD